MKGDILITEKVILWDTRIGSINCYLRDIMKKEKISIYQLSRITNLRYEVINRYYNNEVFRYDSIVLAKLCYSLNCKIDDLLKYEM